MKRRVWRAPLLAMAVLSLSWGVWLGLLRLGWVLPLPWPDQLILHGPLMIGGFLGTLIGLERAVGIAQPWAYGAPALTGAGSIWLVLGPPGSIGPLLITLGSAIVVIVFVAVLRRQRAVFVVTMLIGAVAWVVGNVSWLAGAAIYRVVFWWIVFIVCTIAGERLELSRLLRPRPMVRKVFAGAMAPLIAGAVIYVRWPEAGVRIVGAGLCALAGWLAANDVARRTVRQPGVTRFIAACLLSGYVWLGAAGAIAIVSGAADPGVQHDAILHAVFLGFVVSMIFGHAPIVFPAILGQPLPYRPRFYGHLILLHASVAMRVTGDLVEDLGRWRAWGGLLNACALSLFLASTISSLIGSRARAGGAGVAS
jgi:hypothetical protein